MEKNQDENKIVPNWDLIGNNNTEPHIITVGMGSWRSLKSNPYMIHRNADLNKIRILDIGEAFDSTRKLDGNQLLIGLSSDITDIEDMTDEQTQILTSNLGVKFFIDEWDANNLKNLYDEKTLSLRKHNGIIDENSINILDTRSDTKDLVNLSEEQAEIIKSNLGTNFIMNKNIPANASSSSLDIESTHDREKYSELPTEEEFKKRAWKLKEEKGIKLTAALNELSNLYGYSCFNAIKPKLINFK